MIRVILSITLLYFVSLETGFATTTAIALMILNAEGQSLLNKEFVKHQESRVRKDMASAIVGEVKRKFE